MFGEPVGNCLSISRTKDALKDDSKNPDPENYVSEFFNVETKELTEAFEIDSNIEWCKTFPGIYAETEDYYVMPYKEENTIEYSEYGYPIAQLKERKVGLISKKDFWNKNYNFEEIAW